VLSKAPVNALAEFGTALVSSRGVWEHLEVLRSPGEVSWSFWEIWICFPD